ncbi:MAG: OB-fold domain-containing protein [Acidobacteria bacterium]|nr:OB-fold domain-containing protein [Acidobacteriota bacterium]
MAGIVTYGAYVPYNRLDRGALGGRGERAVAGYDENSVSMAVEAAREALRGGAPIDTLCFATTTPGYAEKLDAATIHAALDLPANVGGHDLGGSGRAGLASLTLGNDMALAGRRPLVCLSEVMVGAPGGAREASAGDGAAAFTFGPSAEACAEVLAAGSMTDEFMDVWRAPSEPFANQWEERFGAQIVVPLMLGALESALSSAGISADSLSKVIVDSTNPRAVRGFVATAGIPVDRLADDLAASVGRAGTAHVGLALANALDEADPGDRIAVIAGIDGADAIIFEVTDRIAANRPERSVERWIEAKRNDLDYNTYLKWRGVLPFEKPRRPDPKRPAAPPSYRAERWKFAFVGSRCTNCGTANLPPQRVCVECDSVDETEPESFADAAAQVATYTQDNLAYSLQPPVVVAMLDFDQGGRLPCQLTDIDPHNIRIGDRVEMTFRCLHTAEGIHNYFWKARPRR